MKKLIICFLVLIALSVTACTPSSSLNETNTLVATRIVNAADEYLDGKSTLRDVVRVVDRERGNIDESGEDRHVSLTLNLSTFSYLQVKAQADGEDVSAVREARNKVAELAGIRRR